MNPTSIINEEYVAEVVIPTSAYTRPIARQKLELGGLSMATKCYVRTEFAKDLLGTHYPTGSRLTAQYPASSLAEAEDKAFKIGGMVAELLDFQTGSPRREIRLTRIAQVSSLGHMIEQYVYLRYPSPQRFGRVALDYAEVARIVRRLERLSSTNRDGIMLSVRWYNRSVSASDADDAYLSTWVGLERVGPMISAIFHANGEAAPCKTCQNKTGMKRDSKFAGMEHLMRITVPELLARNSFATLLDLRNDIAHGLSRVSNSSTVAEANRIELQTALAVGILTCLGRLNKAAPPAPELRWSAFMPRDYEERPDGRHSIVFERANGKYRPYLGEWIEVTFKTLRESSQLEDEGSYVWRAGLEVDFVVSGAGEPPPKHEYDYVNFERSGIQVIDRPDLMTGPFAKVKVVPWRSRPTPPSWIRLVEERRPDATDGPSAASTGNSP